MMQSSGVGGGGGGSRGTSPFPSISTGTAGTGTHPSSSSKTASTPAEGGGGGGGGVDLRGRMTDSLGRTMGPFGGFETPGERKARYWSIAIASLNLFIDAVMFPILIPTQLFYYRMVDGHPVDPPGGIPPEEPLNDTFRYAWLFVTFSAGQFIFTPVFNMWYQRRGMKEAIITSKLFMIIGNFIYAFGLNIWVLGAGRFLIGMGSSTILTTRSYVTYATQREERALYLHLLASLRLMGLMGGPLLGYMFIGVDFDLWEGGPSVDRYTAPAMFCGIIGVLFVALMAVGFKEFKFRLGDELKTKSERESVSTGMIRDYRVSEVTPLIQRERQMFFDRTALMVGNLVLLAVGAGYSVFAMMQPLLSYDQFGWGVRENYIFFGISALICLLCCLLTPAVLSYVDSRAVLLFSLVATSAGFLGRIHFAGSDEAWKVQFLSVTVSLIVTGYTTTSVILFGLFTKQLAFGESMTVVNVALSSVNIAQALTPLWAIGLYNVDQKGTFIWVILSASLVLSAVGVLLFWKRLVPKALPATSINSPMILEDVDDGDDDEMTNTFRYAPHHHRGSQTSTLNQAKFQAWRASLAKHIPGTPDSGYGYLSEGSQRKKKAKKKPKRRETSPQDSGDSEGETWERRRSSRREFSTKEKPQEDDQESKKARSGRNSPDPLSATTTTTTTTTMAPPLEKPEEQWMGEGEGKDQRFDDEAGEGGVLLMKGETRVGEGGRKRSDRKGAEGAEDDEDDDVDGEEEGEEEGGEDGDDSDDDDEDLLDDRETGIDDASELDDAPEIETPMGSMAKLGMQKLSRRYSKTKPDSFSRSF